MRRARILFAWALTVGAVADAQPTQAPLSVRIESPAAGVVDEDFTTQLEATVSDPTVTMAALTVNGVTYEVPVDQGRVRQRVLVVPGNNRVLLTASRRGATARDALTFHARGAAAELMVVLAWPSHGEIIDLWTREPGGETCKWDHRTTASGGRLLDFSNDAIGFGSQAYVLPTVRPGRYRVKIHYWGANAQDDARAGDLTEMLSQLDALERRLAGVASPQRDEAAAEHRALVARMDAWALPAATQTPVHGEVLLFPNTAHERRWSFQRVVGRAGELGTLGEVEVTAEMIRAARETAR